MPPSGSTFGAETRAEAAEFMPMEATIAKAATHTDREVDSITNSIGRAVVAPIPIEASWGFSGALWWAALGSNQRPWD